MKVNLPSIEKIEQLSDSSLDELIELDKRGILVGCNEDIESFKKRLLSIIAEIDELENKIQNNQEVEVFDGYTCKSQDIINYDHIKKLSSETEKKYSFIVDWVPGFYNSKGLGLFGGGCSITSENGFCIIILRKSFQKTGKWLLYTANEIIIHELTHTARSPINDSKLEEFFAYSLSPSSLRRYLGNCFRIPYELLLLLAPILLLLCMEVLTISGYVNIPISIFWVIIFIYPLIALFRNALSRKVFFKAQFNLTKEMGLSLKNTESILFRCSYNEIKEFSKRTDKQKISEWIHHKHHELRWKIIKKRFLR